ncbi:poly-beta-1,6-N-acetyl-D-glucosamine biosynthesis protein PgaD [Lysobacter xanthus]
MKADAALIRVRRAQRPATRTFWGLVTFAFWIAYAYLWLPGLTLVLWWFGLRDMYGELYERSEQLDPFVVFILPVMAVLSSCGLLGWAEYNRLRFTGNDRRGAFSNVALHEIAETLGAAPGVPEALRRHRVVVLRMDDDAHPVGVVPVPDAVLAGRDGAQPRAQSVDPQVPRGTR